MGSCRLLTNHTTFVHEECCRFAAVFFLGWDVIELIWELDWPAANVQVGEKIFESNGFTVFLPLRLANVIFRLAKSMRHMTKEHPGSVRTYVKMMLR